MSEGGVDIDEISKQYDERGFFKRLGDMFKGLKQPKNSREYKLARLEFQRLKAPIIAIIVPILGVIILIVLTAVTSAPELVINVELAKDEAPIDEPVEEPPPPEEIDMTQDVDVNVDVTTPTIANPAPPSPNPGGEPDKVAAMPSPVSMNIPGAKMRGIGDGDEGGFGTVIGGGQNVEGCLIGILVDLKRDGDGNKISYDKNKSWGQLKELAAANFSAKALSKYYVPNKKVALTKVNISPSTLAEVGPECFGAKDFGGSGWMAYYVGELKPVEKARYRFVGYFDEFIVVKINGKVVLESAWGYGMQHKLNPSTNAGPVAGWKPSDSEYVGKWQAPQGNSLMTVGDWFEADVNKPLKIEIALGETQGGICCGALLIQKEGVEYEKIITKMTVDGKERVMERLKLPLFASRPLSVAEKDKIAADGYKFMVESPVFNGRPNKKAKEEMIKDDVEVGVDI